MADHVCTCTCCGGEFFHHTDDAHICNPCGTLSKPGCKNCLKVEAETLRADSLRQERARRRATKKN